MTESIGSRDRSVEELVRGTVDSVRQAFEEDSVSDEDSIRERVEELRQR